MVSKKVRIQEYLSFPRKPESRIPGKNRDPVFELVPDFRQDDVWTPAFAGVTLLGTFCQSINIKGCNFLKGGDATMKRIVFAAIALIAVLFFSSGAQACFYAEKEYIVVFRSGVSWEDAAAEVRGWGSAYHLATITSREEQKDLRRLLRGLRGEFWIGGYQDSKNQWRWVTGESWDYSRWAKGKPDGDYGVGQDHYLAIRSKFNGHRWVWSDELNPERVSGFIVERDLSSHENGPVVPLPAAAWLFGSGVAVLAGLSLTRRKNQL
jgi:hypothetical protein